MSADDTGELCPSCGTTVPLDKWICRCGRILRLDILRHERPTDRLPIGSDEASTELTPAAGANAQHTYRFDPVEALSEMFVGRVAPRPTVGVDLFALDLAPIELYLLSKIDGARGTRELMKVSGLKQVELSVVLLKLLRAGAITTTAKVEIETQKGTGEWRLPTPVEQMSARAKDEFELYKVHRDRGDVTAASLHLKKSVVYDANPAVVGELEKHYETMVNRCSRFYKEARQLLTQGRAAEAKSLLSRAIVEFPGEAGLYNLLAVWAVAHGKDMRAARDYLERAVQLDPDNETCRANLEKLKRHAPK